jgi:putative Holliday junction resolvase
MRYLGIDYGKKKIGLAIGDDDSGIASPAEVMVNDGDEVQKIIALVKTEGIEAVVVGVPGAVGEFHSSYQLKITKAFIDRLRSKLDLPVHEVDEKFTSVESQRIQDESGTGAKEDALAAMLILQEYLDNRKDGEGV